MVLDADGDFFWVEKNRRFLKAKHGFVTLFHACACTNSMAEFITEMC